MLSATGPEPEWPPVFVFVCCLYLFSPSLPYLCPPVKGLVSARPLANCFARRSKIRFLAWAWMRAPSWRVAGFVFPGSTIPSAAKFQRLETQEARSGFRRRPTHRPSVLGWNAVCPPPRPPFPQRCPLVCLPDFHRFPILAGLHPPSLEHCVNHGEPSRFFHLQPSRAAQSLPSRAANHQPSQAKSISCNSNGALLCIRPSRSATPMVKVRLEDGAHGGLEALPDCYFLAVFDTVVMIWGNFIIISDLMRNWCGCLGWVWYQDGYDIIYRFPLVAA